MKTLFNDGWSFALLPIGATIEDALDKNVKKTKVDIPHDWQIYDTNNLYSSGTGCYYKCFTPSQDVRTSLLFDGVYMDSEVYVNGAKAYEWKYGYTPFLVDITKYLTDGENSLTVLVRYREPNTRWYSGAGIFRDVHIIETGVVHIVHNGVYITARPDDGDALDKRWSLDISAEIINEAGEGAKPLECMVENIVETSSGKALCSFEGLITLCPRGPVPYEKVSVDPGSSAVIYTGTAHVMSPALWTLENPELYRVKTNLYLGNTLLDSAVNSFGFRTVKATSDKGFFLNGKHLKLNGVCMHHDLGALGSAFNVNALRRQFMSLKKMGVNAIRTSHNPVAEPYLALADEMGFLLDSEFTDMWMRPKTTYDYARFFEEWCERDVAAWVRRDRNHPSVVMWSIGNEIYDSFFENEGVPITKRLTGYIRHHDPDRHGLTTIGSNQIEWEGAQKCADHLDVSGYNYAERLYDKHHEMRPDWVIYGSETSSTVQSRGIYHFPADKRLLTHDDNQCSSLENCSTNWGAASPTAVLTIDRTKDYSLGQFIWTGWDYIGEPTPYQTKNSYFGQVDTAGFEKDSYYAYQAEWTDGNVSPMVHILPYWDFNDGQLVDVRIYSNAAKTELFVNGVSKGTFEHDHKNGKEISGKWKIPYEKGEIKAVAYDEEGKVVATDIQRSFEDTAALALIPDRRELKANGEDLIFVEIRAVDEAGNFVANARNRVNIEVTGAGRLLGLDNGDSTDYEQYKGTSRRLFSGKLLAIIGATTEDGEITVTAGSPGLPSSILELCAVAAPAREGISCIGKNYGTEALDDIPIRKIELTCKDQRLLTKEAASAVVTADIRPADATYSDIRWKAVNESGVEANFVKIEKIGNISSKIEGREVSDAVRVTAVGDGNFRLMCTASNGSDFPQVISEYEFEAEGFGKAGLDAYSLVYASLRSKESGDAELNLSFQGGVFTQGGRSYLRFDGVEFGDYGSDEITIPIFHWDPKVPLEIWEGDPDEGGELLLSCTYEHESVYNVYNTNTFKLPKRLRGTKTISIVTFNRISIQGFFFTRYDKAFCRIPAVECSSVTGDSFRQEADAITRIGNNVTIVFDNMDFGGHGAGKITICGRTPNDVNAIHLLFDSESGTQKRMIEFRQADDYEEQSFEIEPVYGACSVAFVFLPGSDFDLKWFKFE